MSKNEKGGGETRKRFVKLEYRVFDCKKGSYGVGQNTITRKKYCKESRNVLIPKRIMEKKQRCGVPTCK